MPASVSASRNEIRRLIGSLPARGLAAAPTAGGAVIVDLSKATDLDAAFALARSARAEAALDADDPREALETALVALARTLDDGFGASAQAADAPDQDSHDRRAAR